MFLLKGQDDMDLGVFVDGDDMKVCEGEMRFVWLVK